MGEDWAGRKEQEKKARPSRRVQGDTPQHNMGYGSWGVEVERAAGAVYGSASKPLSFIPLRARP